MVKKMQERSILDKAAMISELVRSTSTDDRHMLYMAVANDLEGNDRSYSAGLFKAIGIADHRSIPAADIMTAILG